MNARVLKTVESPLGKILTAVLALGGAGGMSAQFFNYMSDRTEAVLEAKKIELESKRGIVDAKLERAAMQEMLQEYGIQLKEFKSALEQLSRGDRWKAKKIVNKVSIPLTQGKPILRGKYQPTYEAVQAEQKLVEDEIKELEEIIDSKNKK